MHRPHIYDYFLVDSSIRLDVKNDKSEKREREEGKTCLLFSVNCELKAYIVGIKVLTL